MHRVSVDMLHQVLAIQCKSGTNREQMNLPETLQEIGMNQAREMNMWRLTWCAALNIQI
jgi:hypothetical protein